MKEELEIQCELCKHKVTIKELDKITNLTNGNECPLCWFDVINYIKDEKEQTAKEIFDDLDKLIKGWYKNKNKSDYRYYVTPLNYKNLKKKYGVE